MAICQSNMTRFGDGPFVHGCFGHIFLYDIAKTATLNIFSGQNTREVHVLDQNVHSQKVRPPYQSNTMALLWE